MQPMLGIFGEGCPKGSTLVAMIMLPILLYLAPFGHNLRCKFWLGVASCQFGEGVIVGVGDG